MDATLKTVYLVGFLIACVIRAPHKVRMRQNRVADRHMPWIEWPLLLLAAMGMVVVPITYLASSWFDFADYRLPVSPLLVAGTTGTAVFVGALWLLWRSHADLGRNFSIAVEVLEEHSLVTEGVYRRIRHPMYAAHFLWAVAQALLLHNWVAGPAMLVAFVPLYFSRVRREEQMMVERSGEEYREYMSRTGRVLPRSGRDTLEVAT